VLYGSTGEDHGVRKPRSLKVASESYREEICEVARLHDTREREAEHEGPATCERGACHRDMQKWRTRSVAARSTLGRES
jgi:hypothetical protein